MAYNLPPPWSSGYALPGNVRDEGLQRRGFVTKQMPRGTYDDPRLPTSSMAVPQYIKDEGYGQGTLTTKWQKRGTYSGPRVPAWLNQHPQVVAERRLAGQGRGAELVTFRRTAMSGLGDDAELPEPFVSYGDSAADVLMRKVAQLPQDLRKRALKQIMDLIDPSLWKRTAEITRRLVAQGVPAGIALPRGLARAMSAGIAAEIIATGESQQMPKARSLLGLGCYGPVGFASALSNVALGADLNLMATTPTSSTSAPNPPPGYSWNAAQNGWERARAGVTPVPRPGGAGTITVQEGTKSGAHAMKPIQYLELGDSGIRIPLEGAEKSLLRIHSVKTLSPQWKELVRGAWTSAHDPATLTADYALDPNGTGAMRIFAMKRDGTQQTVKGHALNWNVTYDEWKNYYRPWLDALGIPPGTPLNFYRMFSGMDSTGATSSSTGIPFVFKHPVDGKDWGIAVRLGPTGEAGKILGIPGRPTGVPFGAIMVIQVSKKYEPNWFARVLGKITEVVVDAGGLVEDAIGALTDLACGLVQSPALVPASTAAGGPAGAAGATLAKGACGGPPPPPIVVAQPSSSILPLAILGAGILAVVILKKRKA